MTKQDFRFAFVSNSSAIAERVLEYANARGMHMIVHLATMESAVPVAQKLLDEGVDVILGGGGTGRLMRQCLRRPVVTIARSHLDLLRALLEAKKITDHIGITHYDLVPSGLNLLAELLHVRLRPIPFKSTQDLVNGISQAIASGVRCIVGGGICVEIAKAQGCAGVVCLPGEDNLLRAMEEAVNIAEALRQERSRSLGTGFVARYTWEDIQGMTPVMQALRRTATQYARCDAPVLIHGETGTGKEILAHALHNASARSGGPFVAVNCAALSESLLESELFGYEEGAFTGARRGGKNGLFLLADGGTLFLDEIGDMSLGLQVRLLRVLETREVRRVGGESLLPVNVRVISASHRHLPTEVRCGRFRADLYYRLATLHLQCVPLRQRAADIAVLSRHILRQMGVGNFPLSEETLRGLQTHPWRGNVRELQAFWRRFSLRRSGDVSQDTKEMLAVLAELRGESEALHPSQPTAPSLSLVDEDVLPLKEKCAAFENAYIHSVLEKMGGSREKAAHALGISLNTLWRKLKTM